MTPEMIDALYRISILTSPEPEPVFQEILKIVASLYDDTMAMVNVSDGESLRFRAVVNTHPVFQAGGSLALQRSFCQFPLASSRPLLIQNAQEHPDYRRHIVTRLKLNRYLGVPVCSSAGDTVGTLCFLDNNTDQLLGNEDIQFLSLLAMRVGAELERERMIQSRMALLSEQDDERRKHLAEAVRAADELRESNCRLDALAREQSLLAKQLADTNAQLQARAEEKRHFVNMVIHDLRHPLTAIRANLHLLGIERTQKNRIANLTAIENRVRALGTLLDELILYDQIETGRSSATIEEIDIEDLIRECISEVTCDNQMVNVEISRDLDCVYSDRRKLHHILGNLVANALKFTLAGRVTVRAHPDGADAWKLAVEDTGIGMTCTERERAFEEYFSGSNPGYEGVGLGLSIAHRLCRDLQAEMTLQSVRGQGTTFQIVFPHNRRGAEKREISIERNDGETTG